MLCMKTEVTKNDLIDLIHHMDKKIDELIAKLHREKQLVADLESRNESLKQNNQTTLDQINEYIQELEQIRNHYVDSNNNTAR